MQLVIFDCDGTLVDSQRNITSAMLHAFAEAGLPPPAYHDILGVVGLSLAEAFRVLAPDRTPAEQARLAATYRDAFAGGHLARVDEPLYPGIRETVSRLSRDGDILLGIATGKSRRGVRRVLEREGWLDTFFTIQTADDHPSKPHPSMLRAAMAEAGVAPEATVMVGDTTFDMAMARAADVAALGVAWGYHVDRALFDAGAHAVVATGDRLLDGIAERLGRRLESNEERRT